jgi:hypothetical protein
MNIIWKKSDNTVAVTHLSDEGLQYIATLALEDGIITAEEELTIEAACKVHAELLLSRGDIPADWEIVAINIELPTDREWRNAWEWTTRDPVIDISLTAARQITKVRIRQERAPLMAALDVQFQRALETSADTAEIVSEKQRLRDITMQIDTCETLDELSTLIRSISK